MEIDVCRVASYVPITDLEFHPENPRTIRRERLDDLKSSILEKGFYEPILVWKDRNVVLAGNHRLKAALELLEEGHTFKTPAKRKDDQLPVVLEDCDAETAEAILYETNNHYAEWIDEKLREALQQAEARTDLKTYGFDEVQLASLLSEAEAQAEEVEKTVVEEHTRAIPDKKHEDDEKTKNLELPVSTHARLTEILEDIAVQLSEKWEKGNSLAPAAKALCDYMEKNGIPDFN